MNSELEKAIQEMKLAHPNIKSYSDRDLFSEVFDLADVGYFGESRIREALINIAALTLVAIEVIDNRR